MELEYEADVAIAVLRQLAAPRREHVAAAGTHDGPASGRSKPPEDVQQRRLADAGIADDRHGLAGRDVEVEPAQDLERPRRRSGSA